MQEQQVSTSLLKEAVSLKLRSQTITEAIWTKAK